MKDHPILFSGSMIRAILEGRKTQTRRVMKPQPPHHNWTRVEAYAKIRGLDTKLPGQDYWLKSPYGKIGDRLWVRETWAVGEDEDGAFVFFDADQSYHYDFIELSAGFTNHWSDQMVENCGGRCTSNKPSIHMVRWMSRIALEVTEVRVQRLQEMNEADAIAEGIERNCDPDKPELWEEADGWMPHDHPANLDGPPVFYPIHEWYQPLWDSINEKRGFGWEKNPWVWVITFKRVHP